MHRGRLSVICAFVALSVTPALAGQTQTIDAATSSQAAVARAVPKSVLADTRVAAFTTIQGNALNSLNAALPNSPVRLRDARYGRIVTSQLTDNAGLFSFTSVDPGTYIVELTGKDDVVLAASQLLTVAAGDTVSAVVKLPLRLPAVGGVAGHTAQQVLAVTAAAAASGVLATQVTGVDASSR